MFWTSLAWSLERTDPDNWAMRSPDQGDQPKLIVQIGKVENVDIKALLADGKARVEVEATALPVRTEGSRVLDGEVSIGPPATPPQLPHTKTAAE